MNRGGRSGLRRRMRRRRRHWRRQGGLRALPERALHGVRWHLSSRETIERWTEARLELGEAGWLFLLGLNNSGTSLLMRAVSAHPEIRELPGEGQLLTTALPRADSFGVRRNWTTRLDVFHWTENDDPAPALRARYDWALYAAPGPGLLLEKSPPDAVRSRWLQANFRPSRFIAIVRHAHAVCEGIRRREGLDIESAARHWTLGNGVMLDDSTHLERFLLLTYEDFCAQPEAELTRIQEFLGLVRPFDASLLAEPMVLHNVDRRAQRLTNLNPKSFERLSAQDIETVNQIAGPVMDRLGYERLATRAVSAP